MEPHDIQRLMRQSVVLFVIPLHHLLMRRTPHKDDIEHGEIKIVVIVLRHDRKHQRRLPIRQLIQRFSVKEDLPLGRFLHAIDTLQKSTFPAAIGSDDSQEFFRRKVQVDAL